MKTSAAYKAFGLGAALGLVVAFAPSCGGSSLSCDASNCSAGCCQNGLCLAGTAVNSCGKAGAACGVCAAGQGCTNQACGSSFTGGGQGGGSGGGGGTAMPCNAATCASGCCSSATSCETGATAAACGTGGASCTACTSSQSCTAKACVANPVIDGGTGTTHAGTGTTDAGTGMTDAGTGMNDAGTGGIDAGPGTGCNPTVVISQVYGAGGNSGSVLNADYVELHNRTSAAIDLNGWSLQYASATGSTWSVYNLRSTIVANGFLLLQTNDSSGTSMALPTPDQLPPALSDDAGTKLIMGATGGKIALVSNQRSMTGSLCATGEGLVDWLGWGVSGANGNPPTNCAEGGTNGPTTSTTLAVFRKETTGTLACVDSNVNSADFVTDAPAPRNSSTAASACTCQ